MIHIDTSALIDSLTGARQSARQLRRFVAAGTRINLSTPVLYEWLRGPRLPSEIAAQEVLMPVHKVVPFGRHEAVLAAELYRQLRRPRGREIDVAIAACAIVNGAALWTLNPKDFADIPGLTLAQSQGA